MADKKISELDLALLINDDAEFPFSQDNAGEPTTFKGRITQLATKIAEDMTFSNLGTTSKKLVGAINELLSLGNPIILGTSEPTSSVGADGNIYIQYTAGTGGASDTVDALFVKLDNAWCEISTGGGSGTTDYVDLSNKPQVNSVELVGNKSLDDLGIMPASLSKTVSGSIASFTDGADNIPVKSLVSEIVAVQSGSGTPSPSNPRAISGFSSGVVTVTDNDQITNTYTFAFGQTVYGGYFDNKGNLVVNGNLFKLVNNNNIALQGYSDNNNVWRVLRATSNVINNVKQLCNIATYNANAWSPADSRANTFVIGDEGNLYLQLPKSVANTLEDFIAYITNNDVFFYHELATPITLAITSQDIPTLLGVNNIYSNCGDVEVTYYTDKADEIVEVSKATASTPLHNYSTDEQVVGTWIDGSTLYEKTVISTSELSKDAMNQIALGITDIDVCVSVSGFASYGSNNTYIPLPYGDKGNSLICLMNINKALSVANVWVGSDYTSPSTVNIVIITLQYTKSST